ncbi:hypothetical protein [Lewinella sp. W8]|uniref:hypothetical protein n=1 Tax=Lewinella sp. W8 TaxID=2528208 RepID=UPI0010684784|nr:hypothetical protein [Lewinella sp. W8]MTB53067.1 hypothetical protein [Lewinella sp. W8]
MTKKIITPAISPNDFKIRCSSIGSFMSAFRREALTEKEKETLEELEQRKAGVFRTPGGSLGKYTDKLKKDHAALLEKANAPVEIGATTKTIAQTWGKSQIYGNRKEFSTKHTIRGTISEDQSIDLLRSYLNDPFLDKYQGPERVDDYKRGTCDVLLPKTWVWDVKTPYDEFTFPLFSDEEFNKDYMYQLNGYGDLYGREKLGLAYCLVDAPDEIIEFEARKYARMKGVSVDEEIWTKIKKRYTFSHLPMALRIRTWTFDLDRELIEDVHLQVERTREYLNQQLSPVLMNVEEEVAKMIML